MTVKKKKKNPKTTKMNPTGTNVTMATAFLCSAAAR